MATQILSALLPDIPQMEQLVKRAYIGKFETEELTPTVAAGDFHEWKEQPVQILGKRI